jgi:pyruvate/2-oxoglutarate dehydrogenase complex dihydrolipoamide dehydrogenase (E3) component
MPNFLTPDLCVIGGGAAGLAVARAARRHGARVVLIEKDRLGGAALNTTSIPSIALAAAGRRAQHLRTAAPFGIAAEEPRINARGVFNYVHGIIDKSTGAITAEQLTAQGIEVIAAAGRFIDSRTVEAGGQQIRARRFVLATGSRPLVPDIPGLSDTPYFTSASIFDNPRKLTHLVILGGSSAAVEMAQALRRLGSEVTLIDAATPLTGYDPELVEIALRRLIDEGVEIRGTTTVTRIEQRSLGIGAILKIGDHEEALDASHILVASGRTPFVDGLAIEKAGILRQGTGGPLALRDGFRTTNRRVYATGEVTGETAVVHGASFRAVQIVRRALFRLSTRNGASSVANAVFTDPEIASFGIDEAEARRRRLRDFKVLRFSLAENDRARAEHQPYGVVKVIVDKSGRLLGAGIVGTGAAEMISLFAFAIGNGMSLRHFRNFTVPYPTLSEILPALADEDVARSTTESAMLRRLLALNRRLP